MTLPRTRPGRLSGARVREALRGGRRHAGSRVILYVRPSPEGLAAAFVAGRRVGGAVQRNRARRVLREAWRSLAPQIDRGADVVFVARRGILRATVAELEEEMRDLLERSELVPA
jgi:ribonuclease P protein component